MMGLTRMDHLLNCLRDVLRRKIPGDLAEIGVWRGGAGIMMRAVLRALGDTRRKLWLTDSFQGYPYPDAAQYPADKDDPHRIFPELSVSLDTVKGNFERYGLGQEKVEELRPGNADLVTFAEHCLELAKSGDLAKPENQQSTCLNNPPNPDPMIHRMLNEVEMKASFFEAYLSEFQNTFVTTNGSTVNDREVPRVAQEFGSMPLVVLTASRHRASWPDFTEEDQERYFEFWKHSHEQLATLSTQGQSLVVEQSGHSIQKDQPSVVIQQVGQIVNKVRHGEGTAR